MFQRYSTVCQHFRLRIKQYELDVMGWNDAAVEIRSSFFQQGKEVNNVTITDSNITVCLNEGYGKGRECPITAFVYKHIEKDFKELFDL